MKKLFLATLLAAFAFGGCVKQQVNTISPMDGETTISIRVPYATVATRAIDNNSVADNRIDEMDVLLFDASDKFVQAFYGTNIVTDANDPRQKTIKVRLPAGTYRTVLLANAHKEYIASPFTVGDDRQTALATLKRSLTDYGNKYASDGTASNYVGFPMWGDADNITITSGMSNTFPAHLYRALTKVNLKVDYVETVLNTPDFVLKSVDVYNYNLSGYLAPTDINWANPKVATELKTREGAVTPISLSYDNTFIKHNVAGKTFSCTDEIFVYESKADNGAWSWEKNTCIVVGGEYLGQMGYYRLDFTQDGTTRLDLLRNHSYNFKVVAIKTSGYTTPEEALKNLPDNLDYTVELWDDFNMDNIDFNGQYYIQYTSREALFTQFGTPSLDDGRNAGDGNYIITLKTNLPSLTAKGFKNITAGAGDGSWNEAPAGTWSNGHFNVVIAKGQTIGEETTYTITIKALPAITGDPFRESTFNIVGANLSSALRVTQDKYALYSLQGSPDPSNVIKLDGSARRYPVTITSTHDYGIIFSTTDPMMLTGVWTAQTGGTLLTDGSGMDTSPGFDPKPIPASNTTIWVDINAYDLNTTMVANMEVKHIDHLSDAPSLNYNFLWAQHLYLTASIGGSDAIEVPKAGGEVNIDINSNLAHWTVLEFKVGGINVQGHPLDHTFGSGNDIVKLTLGNNKSGVDQVYTISFFGDKDANWTLDPDEITTQTLTITHKTSLAIRAVPGILGITEDDELTLDGWQTSKPAYIVYFKWGSLIGLSSNATLTEFNATTAKDIVCYTPSGFNTTLYGNPATWDDWDKINHLNGGATTGGTPFPDNLYLINEVIDHNNLGLTHGVGDPCSLDIIKGGAKVSGKYKMPENGYWDVADEWWNTPGWSKRYGTWEQNSDNSYAIWETEPGGQQIYPAAGGRKSNGMYLVGFAGDFWSSTYGGDAIDGRNLYLAGNPYSNGGVYSPRSWAYMIRCITK